MERKKEVHVATFLIALFLWIFQFYMFDLSSLRLQYPEYVSIAKTISQTLVAGLLLISILSEEYRWTHLVVMLPLFLCLLYVTLNTSRKTLLAGFLMIVAAKDVKFSKINLVWGLSALASVLLIGVLTCTGGLEDLVFTRYREGISIERHCLGFSHPNHAGMFFSSFAFFFYIRYKWGWVVKSVMLLLALIVWSVTDSRTFFAAVLLLIFFSLAEPLFKEKFEAFFSLSLLATGGVCLFLFALTFVGDQYAEEVFRVLDKLFSGRLWLTQWYLTQFGVSNFGVHISDDVINEYPFDFSHFRLLIEFGWISFLCYLGVVALCLRKAFLQKNYRIVSVIITILAYGLMEAVAYNIIFAFALLYWYSDTNEIALNN